MENMSFAKVYGDAEKTEVTGRTDENGYINIENPAQNG